MKELLLVKGFDENSIENGRNVFFSDNFFSINGLFCYDQ